MPFDAARIAETKSWFDKAAKDLRAAEQDLRASPQLLEDAVFHCHDRPFRKTHDLVELGQQCVDLDAALNSLLGRAAPLTEYAWKFRYPGEPEEPSKQETDEALSIAREVYDAILSRLPAEVRP